MFISTSEVSRSSPIVDQSVVLCLLTAENDLSASQLVAGMRQAICNGTTNLGKRSLLHVFNVCNNESRGVCIFMHLARHTSNSIQRLLN